VIRVESSQRDSIRVRVTKNRDWSRVIDLSHATIAVLTVLGVFDEGCSPVARF